MASVLTMMSQSVLKAVPPRDKQPGDTVVNPHWGDFHVSNFPAEVREDVSTVFVVTVKQPEEHLWLVLVHERRRTEGSLWVGTPNTTPIVDVTPLIPALRFANGKGLTATKGALARSLPAARALTAADEALLRAAITTSATPTPTKQPKREPAVKPPPEARAARSQPPTAKPPQPKRTAKPRPTAKQR